MLNNNGIYDFLSVTIHTERIPSLEVINISYKVEHSGTKIPSGLGKGYKSSLGSRGFARGKFSSNDFNMKLQKTDWDIMKTFYITEDNGIFTHNPTIITVMYKEQNNKVIAQDVLTVVFTGEDYGEINANGGTAIEVTVKGFLLKAPTSVVNGIPTNGAINF